MLPKFLIIGTQRSATGWIAQCLREHPDVYMAKDETRFFDIHYHCGAAWWEKNFFSGYAGERTIGEKTANYIYDPIVPERIAVTLPDVKLIVCLRNPVERIYSAFLMKLRANPALKKMSFQELIDTERDLIKRGFYYSQIKRFLQFFDYEKILPLIYEEKLRDPFEFIKRVYRFIGVSDEFHPESLELQTKAGAFENKNKILRVISSAIFSSKSPLRDSTVHKYYTYYRSNIKTVNNWNEDQRKHLMAIYDEEIKLLESFLGYEISIWK